MNPGRSAGGGRRTTASLEGEIGVVLELLTQHRQASSTGNDGR